MALKQRKIPMRMCVGCREMKPKMELLRIVKPQDADAHIDRTGKAKGRGAYVCQSIECLKKAQKSRALDRALDTKIEDAVFDQLQAQIQPEEA
ncbi:MAG: YlxR family protein [Clostridiales bacterium]|nr:YlxR family protein [Clostridiales bacterium]